MCLKLKEKIKISPTLVTLIYDDYGVIIGFLGWLVATPLWPSVGVKPNTPKVGDLESSGTPECLEFDSKAQNSSH
jgi:hypothetical protein